MVDLPCRIEKRRLIFGGTFPRGKQDLSKRSPKKFLGQPTDIWQSGFLHLHPTLSSTCRPINGFTKLRFMECPFLVTLTRFEEQVLRWPKKDIKLFIILITFMCPHEQLSTATQFHIRTHPLGCLGWSNSLTRRVGWLEPGSKFRGSGICCFILKYI